MLKTDFLVIGAGIAGTSIAAHLSAHNSVLLCDMESRPGYHTTGRSAASYEPNYGPPSMLAFTRASGDFFFSPPQGFSESPLVRSRASLFFEADGQEKQTEALLKNATGLEEVDLKEAARLWPVLRNGYATRAFLDRFTADLDVDLILNGYLRMLNARGGNTVLHAPLRRAERLNGFWRAEVGELAVEARTIINAAGAWGDEVARICGVQPVGLQPKRRSIAVIPMAESLAFQDWPMVTDVGESWYAKPQSGKLILSSADATPVEPHDAWADDMAIAEGVDRLMQASSLEVTRVEHSWGGLRVFVPDGNPVIGFDSGVEGFFWLVGQGGYGIQTCPALSETAACMARHQPIPRHVVEHGLHVQHISPERIER